MSNVIQCETIEDMGKLAAQLQREGIKFEGNTIDKTITITGY